MERETTIGKSFRRWMIRSGMMRPCKRLLSEKIILAWIMKSCLEEYRDYDVKEIARRYIEGSPRWEPCQSGSDESAGGMEFTEAHCGGQSGGRGKGDKIPL